MAQSSAQRDPSMEEILASIRKIIEEGEDARHDASPDRRVEPVRVDASTTPMGPAANDVARRPLPASGAAEAVTQALAERAARVAAQPVRDDVFDEMEDLSLSLDDFVIDLDDMNHDEARTKVAPPAAPARTAAPASSSPMLKVEPVFDARLAASSPAPSIETVARRPVVSPDVAAAPRTATPTIDFSVKPRVAVAHAQPAAANVPPVAAANVPPVEPAPRSAPAMEPAAQSMQAFNAALQSVSEPVASLAAPVVSPAERAAYQPAASAQNAILSRAVEKKVAASLAELSDALAVSRGRSLEQIAEEMMRPLLQSWLENNLPSMVERVVREEIERIARGTM